MRHNFRCFRNVGDRNSTYDTFRVMELGDLHDDGELYDPLAVPAEWLAAFATLAPFARRRAMTERRGRAPASIA